MWKRLRMAVRRLIGRILGRSVSPATIGRVRAKDVVVVCRCTLQDSTMTQIDIDVIFGNRIDDSMAAAVTADLLTHQLVNWVRILEANTGERYYKMVRDQMDEWYLEPGETDGTITVQ